MSRALAIFAALALALLAGCGASQAPIKTADTFAEIDDALNAAAVAITEGHRVLRTMHEAERERIEQTAPDAATGHRRIDELQARYQPAWDAYEVLTGVFFVSKAAAETAKAAVGAGRKPDALLLGRAIVRLAIASEDLWRAIEALGQPRAPARSPVPAAPPPGAGMMPPKPGALTSPPNQGAVEAA
ncbi:hypothetical protein [Sorangium sp. So ce233]|uniref:hypothetical protein n=1 Tax=Sorangium sp. So ce233 TaxID=3133290 RepID=UPI003F628E27